MIYQRTLADSVKVAGIGIHSGLKVSMTLHPAEADTGIVFLRSDNPGAAPIKADALNVGATENNTAIGTGREAIHTIEHLVSALYGFGINNVFIEIDGPEVPTMDGSSASFVFLIKETGVRVLNKTKKFLVVLDKVTVRDGDKWATIEPADNLQIDSTIVFAHPLINTQRYFYDFNCESYINEIARARTFGMFRDVDYLKRRGLIKGGSLDNAIVLDDFKVMNPEGLRYTDEFVRHKILDTIGDVSLLGYDILGKITTYKSGHKVHNILCRELLQNHHAFEIVNGQHLDEQKSNSMFELPQSVSVTSY
jgi:UDP-3-O-[3-hydroxymyristoyl] N-acetylglucosamine deacetylase